MPNTRKLESVAIDLGATTTKFAHFVDGEILKFIEFDTPRNPDDFISRALEELAKFEVREEVYAIGVGAAGFWDKDCVLRQSLHLPEYLDYPLWNNLSSKVNTPVYLKSDVELAALGESVAGHNAKYDSLLYINIGTGFSGGLYKDDEIFTTNYSPTIRLDYMVQPESIKERSELAGDSEEEKNAVSTSLLSTTLINLSCILSPQVITIGGGKVTRDRWNKVIKPATEQASLYLDKNLTYQIEIKRAKLKYPTVYGAYELVKKYAAEQAYASQAVA